MEERDLNLIWPRKCRSAREYIAGNIWVYSLSSSLGRKGLLSMLLFRRGLPSYMTARLCVYESYTTSPFISRGIHQWSQLLPQRDRENTRRDPGAFNNSCIQILTAVLFSWPPRFFIFSTSSGLMFNWLIGHVEMKNGKECCCCFFKRVKKYSERALFLFAAWVFCVVEKCCLVKLTPTLFFTFQI